MPDQIEDVFAGFRAQNLSQVRPPGPAAARRTVRRRRAARRVTVAAALALVAGGVTAAVTLPAREQEPVHQTQSLLPAVRSAAALPGGEVTGGVVPDRSVVPFPKREAGDYTVSVACGGSGGVSMKVLATIGKEQRELGGQDVSCTGTPRATLMSFRLTAAGNLGVLLQGDTTATGTAEYALTLVSGIVGGETPAAGREVPEADLPASDESIWNADRAAGVLTAQGLDAERVTTEQRSRRVAWEPDGPGEYIFQPVCAGQGAVQVIVLDYAAGDDSGTPAFGMFVPCFDEDLRGDGANMLVVEAGHRYEVQVIPAANSRNTAGLAFSLQPE